MENKEYYIKNLKANLGLFILEKRLKAKMTQANLAKQLGISPPEISQYETGIRLPTLIIFLRMFVAFKLQLKDIRKIVAFCKIVSII